MKRKTRKPNSEKGSSREGKEAADQRHFPLLE